jgi:hypothetical protein
MEEAPASRPDLTSGDSVMVIGAKLVSGEVVAGDDGKMRGAQAARSNMSGQLGP